MEPSLMLVMTLIHACIAIITTVVNIYVAHRRIVTTSAKDARRLRASFIAELEILKSTYNDCVTSVYEEKTVIMSGRPAIAVYRGSLGKLSLLDDAEIPAVVAAYAFCETIEGFLAAHGRSNGQSSYTMGKDREYANALIALYHRGVDLADAALVAMGGGEAPSPRATIASAAIGPVAAPSAAAAQCA